MDKRRLADAGILYEQAVERFSGRISLYEMYLRRMFQEDIFSKLEHQLLIGQYREALQNALILKIKSDNLYVQKVAQSLGDLILLLKKEEPDPNEVLPVFAKAKSLYQAVELAMKEEHS